MLTIGACNSSYIVSRDHPWPERLRSRLDDIALRTLPQALGEVFGGEDARDGGIWFIRNLDIELEISTNWDDDRIARCWAEEIGRSFNKAVADGQMGAVFFPDRAAYLACYFIQLAEGPALRQWFFREFSGLSALPPSAAIRTVIEEDSGAGRAAFIRMKPDELEKVLAALSEADARRILFVFGGRAALEAAGGGSSLKERPAPQSAKECRAVSHRDALDLLWKTWGASIRSLAETGEALFHYLAASREQPHAAGIALAQAAGALTRLDRKLRREGATTRTLLAALAGGDIATLYTVAGSDDAEPLRPLLDASPEWIWQVGRKLAAPSDAAAPMEGAVPGAAIRFTPFGGSFLLLPILDSLPVSAAGEDWPALEGSSPETAIRFLILIKCLGRDRSEAVFADPLLRDLFRIPPGLSLRDAVGWKESIPPRRIAAFHRRIAGWQTASGLTDARESVLEPLADSSMAVLLDPSTGAWRWRGNIHRPDLNRLKRFLPPQGILLCRNEEFRRAIQNKIPACSIQAWEESKMDYGELSARLDRLSEDDAYLSSSLDSSAPNESDRGLTVAAQNVLRAFARRLPGFANSGLSYLHRNFLDLIAGVEEEPGRRIVRLGKPPLNLVLAMAGQNRGSYRADWLDDRPFELYPQE